MTPLIVAMFYCTYCICVVAMWQGFYDNDWGGSIDDGGVVVMEWKSERREGRKGKKERALGLQVVGSEAWLDDWLAGQCGVLDFAWLRINQGFLRQNDSVF